MASLPLRGILRAMRDASRPDRAATDDETVLVRRAKDGERGAFDRLVELHLEQVWATVWRIVRHREDAEDVVQEVFLAAHRALSGFRGDAKLSTWLHRIAVTRAINHRERAEEKIRRASDPVEPDAAPIASAAPSPLHALEAKELMRRLADCLDKLPAAWRAVLALRDAEALAYEEIAQVLQIELGTVRSRLARARVRLKDCVEGRVL